MVMKYLLYYVDGFIKKFPLRKASLTIGRGEENDLWMDDDFLSRKHLKVQVKENHIIINDLHSTNGTFVNHTKINRAEIQLDDSFRLGSLEFYLKEGSDKEFKTVAELIPIFRKIKKNHEDNFDVEKTRYIQDIYHETLKQFLHNGLKKNDLNELLQELSSYLINLNVPGSFYLISREGKDFNIQMAVNDKSETLDRLKRIIKKNVKFLVKNLSGIQLPQKKGYFNAYPVNVATEQTVLIYLSPGDHPNQSKKLEKFMITLAKELSLLMQLLMEKKELLRKPSSTFEEKKPDFQYPIGIVTGSPVMKDLIKQTQKIANSDLFILIQGESGTGKELFAKLIHYGSKRRQQKFVAINCAAIPDDLLESELFGYEKGAFTGAFKNKQGKLELSSGGTLVLDEIGNMPLPLQAKLLRALQEYEFYRLGSSTPIKVDLRIISLTNLDINRILSEHKIREDLYYRLAHHVISIPPLRERKEDIASLITHFTQVYSKKANREIKSFSLPAFEMLKKYDWPGNVRQLENEINRLVNLCDDGDVIHDDLISVMIRTRTGKAQDNGFSFSGKETKNEKQWILKLLEKNKWNKSETAREMNMTYQGLHKKMKRLGIKKKK